MKTFLSEDKKFTFCWCGRPYESRLCKKEKHQEKGKPVRTKTGRDYHNEIKRKAMGTMQLGAKNER